MKKLAFLMALLLVATCCLMASCGEKKKSSSSDKDSGDFSFSFGGLFGDKSSPEEDSSEGEWKDGSEVYSGDEVETSSEDETSMEESFDTSQPETSQGDTEDLYMEGHGHYTVKKILPYLDFERDTFTVCVTGDELESTYYSEEVAPDLYATTDPRLNEAVRWRNLEIKMEYGVEIQAYKVRNVAEAIMEDCAAGVVKYDVAMPFMGQAARLAQDAMLYDLTQFEFIHLDAPWWDQAANESLSIGGKLFYTTGDISMMQKNVSFAILFNKELYDKLCSPVYGSMYDLVRDGRWTLDLMAEMCALAEEDLDDNGVMTYEDRFGMFGTNGISGFYSATGNKLIEKDQKDLPIISFATEKSVLAAERVLSAFKDSSWYANTQKMTPTWSERNVWEAAMAGFGNDRSLFYLSAFSAVKKLGNYMVRDHMGILPVPKGSEDQKSYYTPANIYYAYGICIPVMAEDPDFSAYMIELMACEAKNYITPEYLENLVKWKDTRDDESLEMLDLIFDNVVYDLGVLHSFGGIHTIFEAAMNANSSNIVAYFESIEAAALQAINDYVSDFYLDE